MGLSNEERYLRVFNTVVGMQMRFDPQDRHQWDNLGNGTIEEGIADVKESLEQLSGILIQQTDTNGLYWFMGESEDSFRGLTMMFFRAKEPELWRACMDEAMEANDEKDLTLREFALRLGFGKHYNMLNLAHWWDMWCFIPSLLYGMNRYDDELFESPFRKEVNRLISRMLQLRAELALDRYQEEQVMLLKYKLFVDDSYNDERSCDDHCDALRVMTQEELEEEVKKRDRAQYERRREGRLEQAKKDRVREFIDPVYGDVAVTVDGLVAHVEELLREQKRYYYFKRLEILRALELYDGDVECAAQFLHEFGVKRQAHARRYGHDKVKICKRCKLKVLDQRNKTGYCAECLPIENRRNKRSKK